MTEQEQRTTVTIARQMGCGGAYVGQVISRRLKLKYVDREVLRIAAESLGLSEKELERTRERLASFWERIFHGLTFLPPESPYTPPPARRFSDDEIFQKQVAALKQIAQKENCVIVGYGSAHVLPCHSRMINLYFHAPLRFRIKRVMEVYNAADRKKAAEMIAASDAMRRRYFTEMTGRDWACADNYHLCLDTSLFPLDKLAERLIRFIDERLKIKEQL